MNTNARDRRRVRGELAGPSDHRAAAWRQRGDLGDLESARSRRLLHGVGVRPASERRAAPQGGHELSGRHRAVGSRADDATEPAVGRRRPADGPVPDLRQPWRPAGPDRPDELHGHLGDPELPVLAGVHAGSVARAQGEHTVRVPAAGDELPLAVQRVQLQRVPAADRRSAGHVPAPEQARLLPAVRRGDGAAAPDGRGPGARRYRVHDGHLRPGHEALGRHRRRRARLGRGLVPALRLGHVRSDAGRGARRAAAAPRSRRSGRSTARASCCIRTGTWTPRGGAVGGGTRTHERGLGGRGPPGDAWGAGRAVRVPRSWPGAAPRRSVPKGCSPSSSARSREAGARSPRASPSLAVERRFRTSPEAAAYVRKLRLVRFGGATEMPTLGQRRALRAQLRAGLGFGGAVRALWALPPRPQRHRGRSARRAPS